LVNHRLTVGVH
jgi:hypothetical protein